MKVMIVVTHLLGSGHLSRALTLVRAFQAEGHAVTIVSGGQPVPHLDAAGLPFIQLPPLRSDGTNFTRLLTDEGQPAAEDYMAQREAVLTQSFQKVTPDVLMTELFPFGRRVLSDEFLTLLDCAKRSARPPLVLASVRDILAPPSKPSKAERAAQIVADYYDGVLVHSVEDMVPLSASWPVTPPLAVKLHYTGFVAPPPPDVDDGTLGQGEIIVSAGGGAVGDGVFNAAVEAANLDDNQRWRILVGGADPHPRIQALSAGVNGQNVVIEPARPDFRTLLRNAACSVSLCGYNTALDVLQTSTPAVFVPFDDGGEVEQGLRADTLSLQGGIDVIRSRDLTGQTLAKTVSGVMGQMRTPVPPAQMQGAQTTVRIVTEWVDRR